MGVRVSVPQQSTTGVSLSSRLIDFIGPEYTYRQEGDRLYVLLDGVSTVEEFGPGEWINVEPYQP